VSDRDRIREMDIAAAVPNEDDHCADPECRYIDQPHTHERTRPVIDPDGKTVHLVPADPWSYGSRQAALRAAVHKFDGFDAREEWDVRERIVATLDAAGYDELLTIILEAAAERGHVHFSDDCPRSKKRAQQVRQAKHQADRRAGDLAAERDALFAIAQALADTEPLVYDNDDFYPGEVCGLCDARDRNRDGTIAHTDTCLHVRARAFLASRETP
jgi:hypothetical protein